MPTFSWRQVRAWHRKLAWVVALPVLAWTLTGVLHPLMSRWQPSAVAKHPPATWLTAPDMTGLASPAMLLPREEAWRGLRTLQWQGHAYWQGETLDGRLRYFRMDSGIEVDLERDLVQALARHYTGEQAAALSLSRVTRHSAEYPSVNRLLPVWRVAFARDDGLVVFIEPRSLQLAALGDAWKTRFSRLFGWLHSWKGWQDETSRDIAQSLVLCLAGLMVVSGLARASSAARARPAWPRWHRRLGLVVSLAALAWIASAIFHVLAIDKRGGQFSTYPLTAGFSTGVLRAPVPQPGMNERLQLVATPSGPWWRLQSVAPGGAEAEGHHHGGAGHALHAMSRAPVERYVDAATGEARQPADYRRALAASVSGSAVLSQGDWVTRFEGEYGFINKRLPVYRMRFATPDHLAVYIDPADAAIAAVVRDVDRAEGYSFSMLHKAHWLDFLGKDARDAILAVMASLVFGVTLMGLRMGLRLLTGSVRRRTH